jgi:phosphatidate cytidylyltransferase
MTTDDNAAPKSRPQPSNLLTRALTALIGAPLILALIGLGGWPFAGLAFAWAALSLLEFYALGHDRNIPGNAWVGLPALIALFVVFLSGQYILLIALFVLAGAVVLIVETVQGKPMPVRWGRVAVLLVGLAYAGFPAVFLMVIRARPDGLIWVLFIVCITWGTDTLAYFGGRWWGKRPLAPRISPKKTVEGALVGIGFGFAAGALLLLVVGELTPATLALSLLGPPVAVMGDLFESALKRFFHVKDSHLAHLNIIPGHGGVLDRTDSLMWVVTLCYVYLLLVPA